jgi:hypothetical protein
MKKELKNIRIVTDNGEAVILSKQRYLCLIQTLDLLASSANETRRRPRGIRRSALGRD